MACESTRVAVLCVGLVGSLGRLLKNVLLRCGKDAAYASHRVSDSLLGTKSRHASDPRL
jgi:hypothetical protein